MLDVNLAVSLHAVSDEVRDTLVPINRKWPIAELLKACAAYPGASNSRRITFEYAMLKGVNDSDADARELVRLLTPHPRQGEPDPVQPLAGRALRVQLQQPHPPLRRDRERRRPERAHPHAARPRHPRRLRPAQERQPARPAARRSCSKTCRPERSEGPHGACNRHEVPSLRSRMTVDETASCDDLRQERAFAGERLEPGRLAPRLEAAVGILGVVRLVEIMREEVEQAVPRRLVALLDRIRRSPRGRRASRTRAISASACCADRLAAARASGTTRRRSRGSRRRTAASRPRPRSALRARCGRSGGAPRRDRAR